MNTVLYKGLFSRGSNEYRSIEVSTLPQYRKKSILLGSILQYFDTKTFLIWEYFCITEVGFFFTNRPDGSNESQNLGQSFFKLTLTQKSSGMELWKKSTYVLWNTALYNEKNLYVVATFLGIEVSKYRRYFSFWYRNFRYSDFQYFCNVYFPVNLLFAVGTIV